ncbi:MAG TPA: helix-turn-helix domain-containing protein [Ilumatobacter sp.]|nr:helix-turn-helix domain-containing protein [Ilumatobacter sp.]
MVERSHQKGHTRAAILAACAEIVTDGVHLSMDAIADRAGISRATIYRYFSTTSDVVWHFVTEYSPTDPAGTAPTSGAEGERAPPAVAALSLQHAALAAERSVNDPIFASPNIVRLFEIARLQRTVGGAVGGTASAAASDDRPARLSVIDVALDPHAERLGAKRTEVLRGALALMMGPEAMITLLDACHLTEADARTITRWATSAIVQQALDELPDAVPGSDVGAPP